MATMRDVAARAGVSIATVSFFVNGTKPVSAATGRRVTRAMAELGYRHNVVARALASKRTRIIALLFPVVAERLSGIALGIFVTAATRASELGYHLVLWPVGSAEDDLQDLLAGRLVDGVIVMEVQLHDRRVEELHALEVPFVSIGRTADVSALPFVDMDFAGTVRAGMAHLVGLGHARIALVIEDLTGGPLAGYGPSVRTETAYREESARRGLEAVVVPCGPSAAGGRAAALQMLDEAPGTTAVMIMRDDATAGFLRGLASAGREVPRDVSVLSLASSAAAGATMEPALTTFDAPGAEMARLAVEALMDRISGAAQEVVQVLLPCELHEGASVTRIDPAV